MLVICSSVRDDCGSWPHDAVNATANIAKTIHRNRFMNRLPWYRHGGVLAAPQKKATHGPAADRVSVSSFPYFTRHDGIFCHPPVNDIVRAHHSIA
jgi:hypothetical protein